MTLPTLPTDDGRPACRTVQEADAALARALDQAQKLFQAWRLRRHAERVVIVNQAEALLDDQTLQVHATRDFALRRRVLELRNELAFCRALLAHLARRAERLLNAQAVRDLRPGPVPGSAGVGRVAAFVLRQPAASSVRQASGAGTWTDGKRSGSREPVGR